LAVRYADERSRALLGLRQGTTPPLEQALGERLGAMERSELAAALAAEASVTLHPAHDARHAAIVITLTPTAARGTWLGLVRSVGTSNGLPKSTERRRRGRSRRVGNAARVRPDLTALAREIKDLEAQLRDVSEREQERIGHDLHDGLGQELTGVALLLKALDDEIVRAAPALAARVRAVRDMIEQCIATTRALAHGLSPVHLDRDGFAGALEQLAANSQALYGIPVRFVWQRKGEPPSSDTTIDLYRIAQEAIRNAARHSGASEIRVTLNVRPEGFVMTVEDDGCGLPPDAESEGGMGLKIMKYRAGIVGALLELGAREDGGTLVQCTLRHTPPG
jgi:signal transduction histidine kinase